MLEIPSEARAALVRSAALSVKTAPARQQAADLWDAIRAFRKQAEAQKEERCRPLKQAWEDAKKPYDAFIKECQTHEAALQARMAEWDRACARRAAEEQARVQARVDAENAKRLARSAATGQEPVLKVAPVVAAPPPSLQTQAGTTQVRIERVLYRIRGAAPEEKLSATDPRVAELHARHPRLFTLDWVAFRTAAQSGLLDEVTGVERVTEYMYQQRRRG